MYGYGNNICAMCGGKRARAYCVSCHRRIHAYCGKYVKRKLYCQYCEPRESLKGKRQ